MAEAEPAVKAHYRIVGEAFNAYIVVEVGDKMLIIDKHAAHERIIFEQFKEMPLSAMQTESRSDLQEVTSRLLELF